MGLGQDLGVVVVAVVVETIITEVSEGRCEFLGGAVERNWNVFGEGLRVGVCSVRAEGRTQLDLSHRSQVVVVVVVVGSSSRVE